MATIFKNSSLAPLPSIGTTGFQTAYTVPAGKTAVVIHAQIVNVEASTVGASLRWTDASNAGAVTYLTDEIQVPAASAVNPLTGKLVLEAGDTLEAGQEGTPTSALQLTLSVMEIDNV